MSPLPIKLIPSGHYQPTAPTRAHTGDAGLDCYAAVRRWIEPGEITTVPLGFATAIPEGHTGILTLRSSVGANGLALTNGAGIVDSGYRGEVKAAVTTWDDAPYLIEAGARIAQLTIVPILTPPVEVVDHLPTSTDGRGTGGFGSTSRGSYLHPRRGEHIDQQRAADIAQEARLDALAAAEDEREGNQ